MSCLGERAWRLLPRSGKEVLAAVEAESVDAIVTAPPYASLGVWYAEDLAGELLSELFGSLAEEAARVLKPGGSLLLFCNWRLLPELLQACSKAGLRQQNLVVWDTQTPGWGTGFRPRHELILHYVPRGAPPRFYGEALEDVVACKRAPNFARLHPSEKPVALVRRLIELVSPRDGLVVDPFARCAATGEAALRAGRRWLGAEPLPGLARRGNRRLERVEEDL